MARYALIHGAYDVGWSWHLVERELQSRGHATVAPDLPIEDDHATLADNAAVVVDAIASMGGDGALVVVGHSWGGYIAPLVAERSGADGLVLVAAMIPKPGETADELFAATGWHMPEGDADSLFCHDVDAGLAADAKSRERRQSETTGREPWPLARWPDVPTRFVVCREDRWFPADWLRQVVRDRLGIEPIELDSGHTPALSHPIELVDLLEFERTTLEEPHADR
jgi:pimeloyl-ACP methyl ester carboxylesterase